MSKKLQLEIDKVCHIYQRNGMYSLNYQDHHWHGMRLREARKMAKQIYKDKMGGLQNYED